MRILLMMIVLVALACGDDDMPTAPTPTPEPDPAEKLIGTWKYTGNDFDTKLAANVRNYLIGEGHTASEVDKAVSGALGELDLALARTFNFRSDGTVIVDSEPPYRYQVSGNRIIITTSDGETLFLGGGETLSGEYAVTDTALTLHFPVAPLLATVVPEDEEEAELMRTIYMGIEVLTMYFSRQ